MNKQINNKINDPSYHSDYNKYHYKKENKAVNQVNAELIIQRGDVYYADLGDKSVAAEQGGRRPVIIIQNNLGNRYSPSVTVIPVTGSLKKTDQPTHLILEEGTGGLIKDSMSTAEQIQTINKNRLTKRIGKLDDESMKNLDRTIKIHLGLV